MATFIVDESDGPGTHVFIIGVGAYPHLEGGAGRPTSVTGGMGQLSSPPLSAVALLNWVFGELYNPDAPLKSVVALVSDRQPVSYTSPTGATAQLDAATLANVQAAAEAWFDRLDTDQDNVAIFYFCGHGAGDGVALQLMLQDYGSTRQPSQHAINFNGFRLAMGTCRAKKQLYLVDACRVVMNAIVLDPGAVGNSLLAANIVRVFEGANPVLFSAKQGKKAFSKPDAVSYFTEALLAALSSFGVKRSGVKWLVQPSSLQLAIASLMSTDPGKQECPADGIVGRGFTIHVLRQQPQVILDIALDDPDASTAAVMQCVAQGGVSKRVDYAHPWRTVIHQGRAELSADFPAGSQYKTCRLEESFSPPQEDIVLEVSK